MFSQEPSPDERDVVHITVQLDCNSYSPAWRRYPIVKGTTQKQELNPSFYGPKKIVFHSGSCHLRTKLQVLQIFVVCNTTSFKFSHGRHISSKWEDRLYIQSLLSTIPLVIVMAIDNLRKQYLDFSMPISLLPAAGMVPSTWKFKDKTKTHKYESLKVIKNLWYEVLPTEVSNFLGENKIHILEK